MGSIKRSSITVAPEKVLVGLVSCIGLLVVASLLGGPSLEIFHVNEEQNIPTLFSTLQLLATALLLGLTAGLKEESGYKRHWGFLGLLFLYFAIDENVSIHEKAIRPLRAALDTGGVFHFAWIIPVIPFLLIVSVVYIRFLQSLPRRTAGFIVAAGALFVGGAVGMEMVGGWLADTSGTQTLYYELSVTLEESLEMLGVALFMYALLDYLPAERRFQISFGHSRE